MTKQQRHEEMKAFYKFRTAIKISNAFYVNDAKNKLAFLEKNNALMELVNKLEPENPSILMLGHQKAIYQNIIDHNWGGFCSAIRQFKYLAEKSTRIQVAGEERRDIIRIEQGSSERSGLKGSDWLKSKVEYYEALMKSEDLMVVMGEAALTFTTGGVEKAYGINKDGVFVELLTGEVASRVKEDEAAREEVMAAAVAMAVAALRSSGWATARAVSEESEEEVD